MIRRPPRSTRTDTLFPTRRSSDLELDDRRDGLAHEALAGVALADPVADAGGLGDAAAHVGDRHAAHQRVVGEAVDQEGETGAAAPLVAISLEAAAEGVAGRRVVGPGRLPGRQKLSAFLA